MRWQLASTFAVTAMSAGCYGPNTVVCDNGVLCPEGAACTGNAADSGKPLCGDDSEIAQCTNNERALCSRSTDEEDKAGICVANVCTPCSPLLYECRYSEWTQVPSTVSALAGVWVEAPDAAYAVGNGGATLSYDGASWQLTTIDASLALVDVWAEGADVFAVRNVATIYRSGTPTTPSAPSSLQLTQIWGRASDDVVAVGSEGLYGEFDGTTWDWQSFGGLTPMNHVWGADDFVLAVGDGQIRHRPAPRADWQGADWLTIPAPNGSDVLLGVWGTGANDFYVVGNVPNDISVGVLHHYLNGSWSSPPLPPPPPPLLTTPRLNAIWGSGPDDIHVVGDKGVFLHYDGTAWQFARPPVTGEAAIEDIAGNGRDTLAVGADGSIWRLSPP